MFAGGRDANGADTVQERLSFRASPGGGPLDVKIRAYAGRDRGTQAAVHGLLPVRAGLGFFEVNENRIGENRSEAYGAAGDGAFAISDATPLTSSSYNGGKQDLQQAAGGSPLDILDINSHSKFRQFSKEVRGNYSGDGLSLVAGRFCGWDRTDHRQSYPCRQRAQPGRRWRIFPALPPDAPFICWLGPDRRRLASTISF